MSAVIVRPCVPFDAVVHVPGSKSVANRALVCALLADGVSVLSGVPDGDDAAVIVDVLRTMGRLQVVPGGDMHIRGGGDFALPGIVDARLAGTSSRFLTAVAALSSSSTVIDGDGPLRERPMADLHDALAGLGAVVEPLGEPGHLPVAVSRAGLTGGAVAIKGDVSSQFVSALMLVAPVLPGGLTINVRGDLVSRSYVEMTASVMRDFGAVVRVGAERIEIESGAYEAREYSVEPDFSSAAFPLVGPVLAPGRVRVPGLARGRLQGDSEILQILSAVGCTVLEDGNDIVVERSAETTCRPADLVMTDCSDLVPAVAVALSAVAGVSRISGVGFIKNKESDRLGDLAAEMRRCGAHVLADDDGLTISGITPVIGCTVDTHHDHRLAMSLALLSLVTGAVRVRDHGVVSKSWPTFFGDMQDMLSVETVDN